MMLLYDRIKLNPRSGRQASATNTTNPTLQRKSLLPTFRYLSANFDDRQTASDNLTPEILIGISTHKTVQFRHDQEVAIRYFPPNNSIADLRISITSNIHSSLDLSLHIIHPPYFLLSAGLRVVNYVLVL